jgi:hypothetical protein
LYVDERSFSFVLKIYIREECPSERRMNKNKHFFSVILVIVLEQENREKKSIFMGLNLIYMRKKNEFFPSLYYYVNDGLEIIGERIFENFHVCRH